MAQLKLIRESNDEKTNLVKNVEFSFGGHSNKVDNVSLGKIEFMKMLSCGMLVCSNKIQKLEIRDVLKSKFPVIHTQDFSNK